jgi:EAL domain-containing protein (putative c-di-GMP-specific phosphodiesterase class I)/CHASE2 domain-containing sensor protein
MGKGLRASDSEGKKRGSPRFRLLAWSLLVALIFGITDIGKPIEDALRNGRDLIRKHDASGEIVVVALDDRSIERLARWPWPRRHHAALVDELSRLGARRIFFDLDFAAASDPKEDRLMAEALARHRGKVVLAVQAIFDPETGKKTFNYPIPAFAANADKASITVDYDFRGIVWDIPYGLNTGLKTYPSFAAQLAGKRGPIEAGVPIDYSIDYRSIPTVSAVDVIDRKLDTGSLAGKTVIVGPTAIQLGDTWFVPGAGRLGGVYLHVLGAETLKAGAPRAIGWLLPLVLALALSAAALLPRRAAAALAVLGTGIVAVLTVPLLLENLRIYANIVPSLLLLTIIAARVSWLAFRQSYSEKAVTHPLSGLPNLNALRAENGGLQRPLIAARITNYAEITSSLPAEMEKSLVEQIAARLRLGSSGQTLYQGDEGVFAWFADDEMAVTLTDHLNALHSLFRSPIVVDGTQLDLVVTFGIERGSARSVANRLGSALVVADEAAAEGHKWKEYDAARLKEAPWRLSLLSQLDAAIDAGELWVAYQPKLDLKTRRTIGAEALVRWTHPEKGPISPAEFVLAAEQSGRIQKLTSYVLERAVQAAAEINAHGIPFGIAVNLSARLIDDPQLPEKIGRVLRAHGLGPELLTLEITETAALGTTSAHLENLARLRELGIQISVDDYGTGLSTLDYLKKIPANEIKIDKSFVQAMHRNQGDRVIVDSTIQLAHSLGRRVVAEGVEDREALYALSLMGCDVAQGFFIGRPIPLGSLMRQLLDEQGERVAALG